MKATMRILMKWILSKNKPARYILGDVRMQGKINTLCHAPSRYYLAQNIENKTPLIF